MANAVRRMTLEDGFALKSKASYFLVLMDFAFVLYTLEIRSEFYGES